MNSAKIAPRNTAPKTKMTLTSLYIVAKLVPSNFPRRRIVPSSDRLAKTYKTLTEKYLTWDEQHMIRRVGRLTKFTNYDHCLIGQHDLEDQAFSGCPFLDDDIQDKRRRIYSWLKCNLIVEQF